jgi:aerobic carbon-monoxide dehydrogenase medium subunit
MKPAAFEFVRAGSIAEATRLLGETNGTALAVAGAQSLGPMLNLRLVQPRLLIDVTGIPDLTRVEDTANALTIGACITTANIEDQYLPLRGLEALPPIAMHIAYRAVRNRGTVGGSVCHADPAADWVSALCALGAECLIAGPTGGRRMPIEQFVTGAYETALVSGEILEAIQLPRPSANGRLGYCKVCRKAGEFALAIGAVLNDPERGQLRIVIGATGGRPIVIADAHGLKNSGGQLDQEALARLMEARGIRSRVERRQKVAAVERAYGQATP